MEHTTEVLKSMQTQALVTSIFEERAQDSSEIFNQLIRTKIDSLIEEIQSEVYDNFAEDNTSSIFTDYLNSIVEYNELDQ